MKPALARLRPLLALALLSALVVALTAVAAPAGASAAGGPQVSGPVSTAVGPTLSRGSRGPAVVTLQQRLRVLRYDVGTADGVYGYSTEQAVFAFQKVQGLRVDGVVTAAVWSRLATPLIPRPRYTSAAPAVEIDLTRRVLFLTQSGTVTRIVHASPGKASTPTPRGSFRVTRRIDGWRQSPLGWLYRPNYFFEGYAVHGSTSVPTYAASHGCVRISTPAMDRIWRQLFLGERVHVYR